MTSPDSVSYNSRASAEPRESTETSMRGGKKSDRICFETFCKGRIDIMNEASSSQKPETPPGEGSVKTTRRRIRSGERALFFLFFFLSGVCALTYEIAWTRRLTLIYGNTVYSISTVLVAFMGGLALGSMMFGRLIDKKDDPVRIYAWLEIGIGVSALVLPLALSALNPAYIFLYRQVGASNYALNFARFALSAGVLVIPTTLMGATLPVLSKFIVSRIDKRGLGIGSLYAVNTLGAVFGCFLAGFILLGWIGISRSEQSAAFINIAIGLMAFVLYKRRSHNLSDSSESASVEETAEETGDGTGYSKGALSLVLIIFGISGMLALAYEILWTRILIFLLGSSIYSFSMILAVYLLGLTAGSLMAAGIVDRLKRPLLVFGWIEVFIGLSALAGMLLFRKLPFMDYSLTLDARDYLLTNFGNTLIIVLPPTLLMGAAFPVVVRIYTRGLGSIGRQTGTLYAVNTVGAILGSFLSGFVLIPLLGSKNSVMLLVLLSIAAGFSLLCLSTKQEDTRPINLLAGALMILPIAGFPLGNDMLKQLSLQFLGGRPGRVIAFDEDATAAVAAVETPGGARVLSVNGVSMTFLCTETQLMAHIPLALLNDSENFLNICFGMGSTFVSARRAQMQVDVVELCPFVFETFKYFQRYPAMLNEPGVGKIVADGRNYLLLSDKTYDVINIDPPPPPWSAGTVNLYTKEFYELCKKRLKPGGIVCQWLPIFWDSLSDEQYKILVATFADVFPHTTIWNSPSELGTYLMGTPERLDIDIESFDAYFANQSIRKDLSLYSSEDVDGADVRALLLFDEDAVKNYVRDVPVMTDDLPVIEFPLFRHGPWTRIMEVRFLKAVAADKM